MFSALTAVLPSCGDSNDKCKDGSNSDNCGVCETACLQGETCIDGACVQTCFAPSKQCGATCDDVQTSEANCGTCGNACAPYGECTAGKCENPLAALQTRRFSVPEGLGLNGSDRDLFMLEDGSLELIKLNGPALESGGVVDHAVLPNGDVLMVAVQDTEGVTELYRVSARGGARTKLNPPLPENGQVEPGLVVSADGTKVLFRADMDADDGEDIDLYALEVAKPGVVVKLNRDGEALPEPVISADGKRAAFIASYFDGKTNRQTAYTIDLSAAVAGEPQELGEGIQDSFDLQMSKDGKRITFLANDNGTRLFAFDSATPGTAHRLENADGGEGNVEGYQLAADGSAVVYASSPFFSELSLWRAPLAGATAYESVKLVDGELDGNVFSDLKLSPDGAFVYFRKRDVPPPIEEGQGIPAVQRLFRVDVTKPRQLTRISSDANTNEASVVDFSLSRDGKSLAFRSNPPLFTPTVRAKPGAASRVRLAAEVPDFDDQAKELRFVDLSQPAPAASILLTTEIPENHVGIAGGYLLTNDRRVLFPADYEESDVVDIYLVTAGTPGVLRKVSPTRPQTSEAAVVSALSLF